MLLFLIQYLIEKVGIHVPSVFFYSSTRMMLSALTTLILTIFLGPFFIKKLYELKIGQPIRSEAICPVLAELHKKKKNTPTMGGILILFSMFISLFLWMDLTNSFTWILAITALWLGCVGGIDDFLKLRHKNSKGMPARLKFFLQILFAALFASYLLFPNITTVFSGKDNFSPPVAKEYSLNKKVHKLTSQTLTTKEYASRLYIPFFKKALVGKSGFATGLFFLFFLFIVIGSSNAVNLSDGLDGLASGLLVMVASVFALVAFFSNNVYIAKYLHILYIEGSAEIGVFLFALIGACLGFLWYNGYPAQVFMGDVGSLSLGGIIGVSAILLKREILLAIVGGIFVMEVLSVVLQVLSFRYRNKKRIFLCSPLHHHFEYKGWAETKVVLRFWIVGLLLAIIGLASLKFQ